MGYQFVTEQELQHYTPTPYLRWNITGYEYVHPFNSNTVNPGKPIKTLQQKWINKDGKEIWWNVPEHITG